jgi:hypothetical protein
MRRSGSAVLAGLAILAAATVSAREACQERTLSLRYTPQAGSNWCWAASGQMVMELLGVEQRVACQCRQVEQVLGVAGCCATPSSCVPAGGVARRCDEPRWPAFVERTELYGLDYKTTCDALPNRQDDEGCHAKALGWQDLAAEICAGRPVLAAFRPRVSAQGHLVVVKGFSIHGGRRVLIVDPKRLCPEGRACEGELDEGFWIPYDEYAAGWGGLVHWVDFYAIRRKQPGEASRAR